MGPYKAHKLSYCQKHLECEVTKSQCKYCKSLFCHEDLIFVNFHEFVSMQSQGDSEILVTKIDSPEICVHPGIVMSGIMSTNAVTIGLSTVFQTTISIVTK